MNIFLQGMPYLSILTPIKDFTAPTAQSKASRARFASALQAYARKLGQCLLELATSTDTGRAEAEMQSCTMETHALNLCVAIGNPRSFSRFHSQRLDGLSGADNSHLSDTFYVEMLVWCSLTACCAAASAYTWYTHYISVTSMLSMPSNLAHDSRVTSHREMHCTACRTKRSRCSTCSFAYSPRLF